MSKPSNSNPRKNTVIFPYRSLFYSVLTLAVIGGVWFAVDQLVGWQDSTYVVAVIAALGTAGVYMERSEHDWEDKIEREVKELKEGQARIEQKLDQALDKG